MAVDRNRRNLLLAFLAGVPGLRAMAGPPPAARSGPAGAVVAVARREGMGGRSGVPDPAKLDDALGAAIARAAGEESPADAMRRLFGPTDVIGIKLNCLAGRRLSPRPELVERLTTWLREAGVPARNIVLWDRTDRELRAAGFRLSRSGSGVRCLGTGDDYDWRPREWAPGGSCFARMLVDDFSALINVGVLKDHDLAGVSVGLKNWYGVIHNPNKHHDDGCRPYVAALAAHPLIRDKLRLTVIDGITAQCHGGPARDAKWMWPWEGILASTDPVAVDAVGRDVIEKRRKEVGLPTLADEEREPTWITEAERIGLGVADPGKIRIEKT